MDKTTVRTLILHRNPSRLRREGLNGIVHFLFRRKLPRQRRGGSSLFILIIYFCLLFSLSAEAAETGQYFKGNGGYGQILSANFSDLDYTKDFSVEAVIDVKPYENKQRYEGIVTKTTSLYSNTSGWGLGLLQDLSHGASIYAKVGDGTNQLSIYDGGDNYGRLHLVMCWNIETKTLRLFINGIKKKEAANTLIDPLNIANNCNFWLGKNLGRLTSPIMYARLWNRDLSNNVQVLYEHYIATKQHQLPDSFDTGELVSEWLMFDECDSAGNQGTTHVKDTIGINHIEMLNGAGIVSSEGDLELVSPADVPIKQHKSVTLIAKGGYQTLNNYGAIKGPLQYYFQIDEENTFCSPALKESGWIADFSSWQPILNPNTTYYWRLKVRDSNSTPIESKYTFSRCFTTESGNTWYVRPAGGNYGLEDGTSYDNAWDGLDFIKWGEAGVEAGDTLYICGTHIRTVFSAGYIAYFGAVIPMTSGTKESPIIIRGDYSKNEPAVIWGAWKDERPGGMRPENWINQGSGVYYNISASDYNFAYDSCRLFEGMEDIDYTKSNFMDDVAVKRYKKLDSPEAVFASQENGVYYMRQADPQIYNNRHEIWLRPFNPDTFAQQIRWSGSGGWDFKMSEDNSYIEFHNIIKICGSIDHEVSSAIAGPYHDYIFKECKFFYTDYEPWNGYNIVFDSCEFAYMSNGIYIIWSHGSIHHFTVINCYLHDIGRQNGNSGTDGHGIGVQNNEYIYIIGNRFERCGSAICFHVGETPIMKHFYILNNFINDMREGYGCDNGSGIVISGDNNNPLGNCEDMVIAGNIVTNCHEAGIASNRKGIIEIYNNIVQNCTPNYMMIGCRLDGAGGNFYNNVSLNPAPYYSVNNPAFLRDYPLHFYFRQLGDGHSTIYDFQGDENLYYPNANQDKAFHFYVAGTASVGTNFSEWERGHLNFGDTVDIHSLLSDPLFVNHSGTYSQPQDFELSYYSPDNPQVLLIDHGYSALVDSGVEISKMMSEGGYESTYSRTKDFYGNPIYGAPDIGAIEYQPPYKMGIDKVNTTGDIRIYSDGKFRNKAEPKGVLVDLAIEPQFGFIDGNYSQWIDIKIDQWDSEVKKWEENSGGNESGITRHIIGGLIPDTDYEIKVNSVSGSGIADSHDGIVKSDSSGIVRFEYNGSYAQEISFEIIPAGVQPPDINGDIDGDGDMDVADLQLCVNYVLSGEYNNNADVDGNGKVDITDVQIVVNKVLGG